MSDFILWNVVLEKTQHDGVPVFTTGEEGGIMLRNVTGALDLIRTIDPRTHRLVQRLLPGGVVVGDPNVNLGWYDQARKACWLSSDHAIESWIEDIALTIVHETCHARLMHCGIGYEEEIRFRVERVCKRRELAFARLLVARDPDGPDYISEKLDQIEHMSADYYTAEGFKDQRRKTQLKRLRHLKTLKAPRFLRRWCVVMLRRRRQRDRRKATRPS